MIRIQVLLVTALALHLTGPALSHSQSVPAEKEPPRLVVELIGQGLMTPWKAPNEDTPRLWVFFPSGDKPGAKRHRAELRVHKSFVDPDDWRGRNRTDPNNVGVWYLKDYVLSVYHDGMSNPPGNPRVWMPGREVKPWQPLRWFLDLHRIVPRGQIVNPFDGGAASAGMQLLEGTLEGTATRDNATETLYTIEPGEDYQQAFANVLRYCLDRVKGPIELRLEPVPGKKAATKRIRLVFPRNEREMKMTVANVPQGRGIHMQEEHALSLSELFADAESKQTVRSVRVKRNDPGEQDVRVNRGVLLGHDPLCNMLHLVPPRDLCKYVDCDYQK